MKKIQDILKGNNALLNSVLGGENGILLTKALNKGLNNKAVAGSVLAQPQLVMSLKEYEGHDFYTLGLVTGGIYFPLKSISEGEVWVAPKRGGNLAKSGKFSSQILVNGETYSPRSCRELLLGLYAEELSSNPLPNSGERKSYSLNKGVRLQITVDTLSTVSSLGFVARGAKPKVSDLRDREVADLSIDLEVED